METMQFDDEFAHWVIGHMSLHQLDGLYRTFQAQQPKPKPKKLGLDDLPDQVFEHELKVFKEQIDKWYL